MLRVSPVPQQLTIPQKPGVPILRGSGLVSLPPAVGLPVGSNPRLQHHMAGSQPAVTVTNTEGGSIVMHVPSPRQPATIRVIRRSPSPKPARTLAGPIVVRKVVSPYRDGGDGSGDSGSVHVQRLPISAILSQLQATSHPTVPGVQAIGHSAVQATGHSAVPGVQATGHPAMPGVQAMGHPVVPGVQSAGASNLPAHTGHPASRTTPSPVPSVGSSPANTQLSRLTPSPQWSQRSSPSVSQSVSPASSRGTPVPGYHPSRVTPPPTSHISPSPPQRRSLTPPQQARVAHQHLHNYSSPPRSVENLPGARQLPGSRPAVDTGKILNESTLALEQLLRMKVPALPGNQSSSELVKVEQAENASEGLTPVQQRQPLLHQQLTRPVQQPTYHTLQQNLFQLQTAVEKKAESAVRALEMEPPAPMLTPHKAVEAVSAAAKLTTRMSAEVELPVPVLTSTPAVPSSNQSENIMIMIKNQPEESPTAESPMPKLQPETVPLTSYQDVKVKADQSTAAPATYIKQERPDSEEEGDYVKMVI